MSILIEVKVSIMLPNCIIGADLGEEVRAAEILKRALWGKDLNAILKETSDGAFRYVPKELIESLGICTIGFYEDDLLIRTEYEAALKTLIFDRQYSLRNQLCGVVVIGQPGIGMSSLFILNNCVSHAIQENPAFFIIYCYAH